MFAMLAQSLKREEEDQQRTAAASAKFALFQVFRCVPKHLGKHNDSVTDRFSELALVKKKFQKGCIAGIYWSVICRLLSAALKFEKSAI